MSPETAALVNVVLGGVNLLALLGIAFSGGHWMGRVEVRLDYLEKKVGK